jgi:hypothetical protein
MLYEAHLPVGHLLAKALFFGAGMAAWFRFLGWHRWRRTI